MIHIQNAAASPRGDILHKFRHARVIVCQHTVALGSDSVEKHGLNVRIHQIKMTHRNLVRRRILDADDIGMGRVLRLQRLADTRIRNHFPVFRAVFHAPFFRFPLQIFRDRPLCGTESAAFDIVKKRKRPDLRINRFQGRRNERAQNLHAGAADLENQIPRRQFVMNPRGRHVADAETFADLPPGWHIGTEGKSARRDFPFQLIRNFPISHLPVASK